MCCSVLNACVCVHPSPRPAVPLGRLGRRATVSVAIYEVFMNNIIVVVVRSQSRASRSNQLQHAWLVYVLEACDYSR